MDEFSASITWVFLLIFYIKQFFTTKTQSDAAMIRVSTILKWYNRAFSYKIVLLLKFSGVIFYNKDINRHYSNHYYYTAHFLWNFFSCQLFSRRFFRILFFLIQDRRHPNYDEHLCNHRGKIECNQKHQNQ